jgi:hypothetical protein
MSLKESWKNLTPTERMLLGMIFVLLILIAARWDKISKGMAEGFRRVFNTTQGR